MHVRCGNVYFKVWRYSVYLSNTEIGGEIGIITKLLSYNTTTLIMLCHQLV